jgi:hypothetical protein
MVERLAGSTARRASEQTPARDSAVSSGQVSEGMAEEVAQPDGLDGKADGTERVSR